MLSDFVFIKVTFSLMFRYILLNPESGNLPNFFLHFVHSVWNIQSDIYTVQLMFRFCLTKTGI
jgi:hypothetical protein